MISTLVMFCTITQVFGRPVNAFVSHKSHTLTTMRKTFLPKNNYYLSHFSFYSTIDDQSAPLVDYDKSPWSQEYEPRKNKGINKSRFRQHVNPLARKFQMPTDMISEDWPHDGTYTDPALPLHIDIGCGKGGFLLSLAAQRLANEGDGNEKRNYLGLEIRPSVAQFARGRITKRNLDGVIDFVGCNANVDLDRFLDKYTSSKNNDKAGQIALVSIQFPDPHFKKSHQKRRVVTPELVNILAKYIPPGRELFIQSDIQEVLDNMRLTIREEGSKYFSDLLDDVNDYMDYNPIGVPTEREISVLEQDLPVYRTMFRRTDTPY